MAYPGKFENYFSQRWDWGLKEVDRVIAIGGLRNIQKGQVQIERVPVVGMDDRCDRVFAVDDRCFVPAFSAFNGGVIALCGDGDVDIKRGDNCFDRLDRLSFLSALMWVADNVVDHVGLAPWRVVFILCHTIPECQPHSRINFKINPSAGNGIKSPVRALAVAIPCLR